MDKLWNLSGKPKHAGIERVRKTTLPPRIRELLDGIYWQSEHYKGKDDVWIQYPWER